MRFLYLFITVFFFLGYTCYSQSDSIMYIIKNGPGGGPERTSTYSLQKIDSIFFVSNLDCQDSLQVYHGSGLLDSYDVMRIDSITFSKPHFAKKRPGNGVKDIDGNFYKTVIIGNQEWMAENLRVTSLHSIKEYDSFWRHDYYVDGASGYCYLNNNSGYKNSFGVLYNWFAVNEGNLCPSGWRIPRSAHWAQLTNYLSTDGNNGTEARVLKSQSGWEDNGNGTDLYGFNSLPSGYRCCLGRFSDGLTSASFWTATEKDSDYAYSFGLGSKTITPSVAESFKRDGYSVRCMRTRNDYPLKVNTDSVKGVSATSAIVSGTEDFTSPSTERGFVWSTSECPDSLSNKVVSGYDGTTVFTTELTGLSLNTKYYVRAYVKNDYGIIYGKQVSFTTKLTSVLYGGGLSDADGNHYKSIIIGNQEWMAENLRTSKYADSSSIYFDNSVYWQSFANGSSPGYCFYDNKSNNDSIYGGLYNGYAVNTSKLCPAGWHVPSNAEWDTLKVYLTNNGYDWIEGYALKAKSGWSNGGNGSDVFGWFALPGGYRSTDGSFHDIGDFGYWWTSSQSFASNVWVRALSYNGDYVFRLSYFDKGNGFSVRCLRD